VSLSILEALFVEPISEVVMDIVYVGAALLFFAITVALIAACAKLGGPQ
jgi:hypothetical protein